MFGSTAYGADSVSESDPAGGDASGHGDFTVTLRISGEHSIEADGPYIQGTNTFVLEGFGGAPMPEGSIDGKKEITVPYGESFDFGLISYLRPGLYDYTVRRVPRTDNDIQQDDSVYKAEVAVFNDESYVLTLTREDTEGKADRIEYSDRVIRPNGIPKTGDSTGMPLYIGIFALGTGVLAFCFWFVLRKDRIR